MFEACLPAIALQIRESLAYQKPQKAQARVSCPEALQVCSDRLGGVGGRFDVFKRISRHRRASAAPRHCRCVMVLESAIGDRSKGVVRALYKVKIFTFPACPCAFPLVQCVGALAKALNKAWEPCAMQLLEPMMLTGLSEVSNLSRICKGRVGKRCGWGDGELRGPCSCWRRCC